MTWGKMRRDVVISDGGGTLKHLEKLARSRLGSLPFTAFAFAYRSIKNNAASFNTYFEGFANSVSWF
jgi:hypothetical protein